jgi:hypothetical protein
MPLPQKVIEQIGREPPHTPGWSGQLLMFSSTIFFVILFIYLGLAFGYTPYLNSQFKKLEDQKAAIIQEIPVDKQAQLITFYSQLLNLQTILARHVVVSPLFDWIEKNTNQKIYFTQLSLNTAANQLTLDGAGASLDDINHELILLQAQPEVKEIDVKSISFKDGAWAFETVLFLDPTYLIKFSQPQP